MTSKNRFKNAVSLVFSDGAKIAGCLFHLSQLAENSKLTEAYIEREDIRQSCRSLVALALVPAHGIVRTFEELQNIVPEEIEALLDYFEDTGIGRQKWTMKSTFSVTYMDCLWPCTRTFAAHQQLCGGMALCISSYTGPS